ncbi:hypothetical protein Tco_1272342 [Tanacetum coccineum]
MPLYPQLRGTGSTSGNVVESAGARCSSSFSSSSSSSSSSLSSPLSAGYLAGSSSRSSYDSSSEGSESEHSLVKVGAQDQVRSLVMVGARVHVRSQAMVMPSQETTTPPQVPLAHHQIPTGISMARNQNKQTCSVGRILLRYQRSCLQAEDRTTQEGSSKDMVSNDLVEIWGCTTSAQDFEHAKSFYKQLKGTQIMDILWVVEEPNELPLTDMLELEEELNAALMHARSRKVIVRLLLG